MNLRSLPLILFLGSLGLLSADPYAHLDPKTRTLLMQVLEKHGADPSTGYLPGYMVGSQRGGLASLPRVYAPSLPRETYTKHPWKRNITATIFWIGEPPIVEKNSPTNVASSWDPKWMENYGGFDDPNPANRNWDYTPKGFTPMENPFYIALPYNDLINWALTKPSARQAIPWFSDSFQRSGKSVVRSRWVAIRFKNRLCYAQWEDVGPFETDDWAYVFGNARPKTTQNKSAGIDLSPAVRDYLRVSSGQQVDWRFAELEEVSPGPWRKYGRNNPFYRNRLAQEEAEKTRVQEQMVRFREARDAFVRDQQNNIYRRR